MGVFRPSAPTDSMIYIYIYIYVCTKHGRRNDFGMGRGAELEVLVGRKCVSACTRANF